jgi:hypothetical protein
VDGDEVEGHEAADAVLGVGEEFLGEEAFLGGEEAHELGGDVGGEFVEEVGAVVVGEQFEEHGFLLLGEGLEEAVFGVVVEVGEDGDGEFLGTVAEEDGELGEGQVGEDGGEVLREGGGELLLERGVMLLGEERADFVFEVGGGGHGATVEKGYNKATTHWGGGENDKR